MTNPLCIHGKQSWERCVGCESDLLAGKSNGFTRELPPSKDLSRRLKEVYDALWINCEPMQQWHAERLWAIITELNSAHEPPAVRRWDIRPAFGDGVDFLVDKAGEWVKWEDVAPHLRASQPPVVKCDWGYDAGDDVWHTDCGELHVFMEGSPTSNGYKFCPYCRKDIDDLSQPALTKAPEHCTACGEPHGGKCPYSSGGEEVR